ncbi:alanine racemase [Corynebacterium liangguodongii]|uniref:Alanine racemase n=1 Tax=Corynebacterium liangguodongii TaxID=2079535 RepID=A0A2S0WFM6_9CORY|nr:alanine racemase [Corynebacterium liangguodongii]AWB84550.1 alanine racemase [Corynebacterium liangguodongii]PWB98866.1 alanine racemase [Corynebacterium liangguodongii]
MPTVSRVPAPHVREGVATLLAAGEVTAPCAVVDTSAFDHNARRMAERAAGLPIRVASKSLRSVAALHRALEHEGYRGILSYSVPEAIYLAREGFTDIVVAYPSVNAPAIKELAGSEALRRAITLMVDCAEHLDLIERAASGAGPVRVAIDIDCSLRLPGVVIGPRRSPIHTPEAAGDLARDIARRGTLRLVGAMGYEGQVASVGDAEGGPKGAAMRLMRHTSMSQLVPRRAECVAAIREISDLEFVNGGGTGSLGISALDSSLTELAAGSGFYTPAIFDHFSDVNHLAAAFFVCQVSRLPDRGWATVNSGGWIASGPPAPDRAPVPCYPAGLSYSPTEGAGEVQTPLRGRGTRGLRVGDPVWFRHAKAGEMTEHVASIVTVAPDGSHEQWDTYRGKGWTLR